jgi:16S rRNA (uracil1498-N3)-methyltransferase
MDPVRRRAERQFLCSAPTNFIFKQDFNLESLGYISEKLDNSISIKLEGSEHKHLAYSLRLKIGECISLFDQFQQIKLHCTINQITKDCTLLEASSYSTFRGTVIEALVGIGDSKTIDFITEKLTELGVNRICFFKGDHTTGKATDKEIRLDRLERIRDSAVKQSNSYVYTIIETAKNLETCVKEPSESEINIALIPPLSGTNWLPLSKLLNEKSKPKKVVFAIGPEGGFSKKEEEFMIQNNYIVAGLACNVLRMETAAILSCGQIVESYHSYFKTS